MLEVRLEVNQKPLAKFRDMLIIKQHFQWTGAERRLTDATRFKPYGCLGGPSESQVEAHFEKDIYGAGEKIKLQVSLDNSQCSSDISSVRCSLFQKVSVFGAHN